MRFPCTEFIYLLVASLKKKKIRFVRVRARECAFVKLREKIKESGLVVFRMRRSPQEILLPSKFYSRH